MVTNCDVDNALWADQPPNDWIPHPTIRDLNQVYCSGEYYPYKFGTLNFLRTPYNPPQDCTWLFTAPPGRKIIFKFRNAWFGYNCTKECACRDYLEIRDTEDMTNRGYRFCCYVRPKRGIFVSQSNKMLVISRIHNSGSRGFFAYAYLAPENATSGYFN
uniref:CUB domain-containing protein n=1 Tax=Romanomermis culicivorax TaxID=13658 RepID=A0A915L364_ROMCU